MIKKDNFGTFDTSIDEGKLLLSAISILTSIDVEDIRKKRWGGSISPDQAFDQVVDLANKIFYTEEYELKELRDRREYSIENIIKDISQDQE